MIDNFLQNIPEIKTLLMIYFAFTVADFITGIIEAAKYGHIKSRLMRDGIWNSFGEIVLLILIYIVTDLIPDLYPITVFFTIAICLKELTSIFENLKGIGIWIPSFIDKMLGDALEMIDRNITIKGNNSKDITIKVDNKNSKK